MKILVDADACPAVIKEILYRAARRLQLPLWLIANQRLTVPLAHNIKVIQVEKGFDVADSYIVEHLEPGDLVISADIPLVAQVIEKKAFAINPRGEFYTEENVKQKLATRNLMDELRSLGKISGGPAPLGQREQQAFANALDRFLNRPKS